MPILGILLFIASILTISYSVAGALRIYFDLLAFAAVVLMPIFAMMISWKPYELRDAWLSTVSKKHKPTKTSRLLWDFMMKATLATGFLIILVCGIAVIRAIGIDNPIENAIFFAVQSAIYSIMLGGFYFAMRTRVRRRRKRK